MRGESHKSSSNYTARHSGKQPNLPDLEPGNKVYIKSDGSKHKARDPYVVVATDPIKKEATLQKMLTQNPKKNLLTVQLQNIYKHKNLKNIDHSLHSSLLSTIEKLNQDN